MVDDVKWQYRRNAVLPNKWLCFCDNPSKRHRKKPPIRTKNSKTRIIQHPCQGWDWIWISTVGTTTIACSWGTWSRIICFANFRYPASVGDVRHPASGLAQCRLALLTSSLASSAGASNPERSPNKKPIARMGFLFGGRRGTWTSDLVIISDAL